MSEAFRGAHTVWLPLVFFSLLHFKLQVVSLSALTVISPLSLKMSVILEHIESQPLNVGFIVDMKWGSYHWEASLWLIQTEEGLNIYSLDLQDELSWPQICQEAMLKPSCGEETAESLLSADFTRLRGSVLWDSLLLCLVNNSKEEKKNHWASVQPVWSKGTWDHFTSPSKDTIIKSTLFLQH